jgi:hypothetical protein
MTAALDRERLAKLCGMFGSDHDGEVVNAARAAHDLVRRCGGTWPDVFGRSLPAPALPGRWRYPRGGADAIRLCLGFSEYLTPWEEGFLRTVAPYANRLSPKQELVLDKILAKVEEIARATASDRS